MPIPDDIFTEPEDYSPDTLASLGPLRRLAGTWASDLGVDINPKAEGPERRVFETTAKGRTALSEALEREEWTTQRERPPFLTWVAMSWQVRPGVFARQIARRREFLHTELAREEQTLREVLEETGHPYHEAVWMVSLMIEQLRAELKWLKKVERELKRRGRAKFPAYAEAKKD